MLAWNFGHVESNSPAPVHQLSLFSCLSGTLSSGLARLRKCVKGPTGNRGICQWESVGVIVTLITNSKA